MVGLGDLSPDLPMDSTAYGVSAEGSVVVGSAESLAFQKEAFRWTTGGGMVGLGVLPGHTESFAQDVSADGSVVVGSSYNPEVGGTDAFIWDAAHGMRSVRDVLVAQGLNLNGWSLFSAEAISDDGLTIIGRGNNPSGLGEQWIATVPEPTTLSLLAVAGLAAARRPRAKKPGGRKGA
jgi:probable HAF family extracellular repeat protein